MEEDVRPGARRRRSAPARRIGARTEIGANTVIGPGVAIGRDCVIGANVTLGFALLGDRVRMLAGARDRRAGLRRERAGPRA